MKFKMAATAGLSLTCHLGITINIKNTTFVKDLPMTDVQFRFNQCNSFREEYISIQALESLWFKNGPTILKLIVRVRIYHILICI
jgi:hypothetical protein